MRALRKESVTTLLLLGRQEESWHELNASARVSEMKVKAPSCSLTFEILPNSPYQHQGPGESQSA